MFRRQEDYFVRNNSSPRSPRQPTHAKVESNGMSSVLCHAKMRFIIFFPSLPDIVSFALCVCVCVFDSRRVGWAFKLAHSLTHSRSLCLVSYYICARHSCDCVFVCVCAIDDSGNGVAWFHFGWVNDFVVLKIFCVFRAIVLACCKY